MKALDAGVSLPKAAEGCILFKRHVAVLLQNPSKKYGGFLQMQGTPKSSKLGCYPWENQWFAPQKMLQLLKAGPGPVPESEGGAIAAKVNVEKAKTGRSV